MYKRLDVRLTVPVLCVLGLSLLAVTAFLFYQARKTYVASLDEGLEGTAWTLAGGVAEEVAQAATEPAAAAMLQAHVRDIGARIPERLTIIDAQGRVLADTHHPPSAMARHRDRPEVADALTGATGIATRYSETLQARMRYLAVPIVDQDGHIAGVARAARSLAAAESAQRRTLGLVIMVGLGALGIGLLAVVQISRSVTGPLEHMGDLAEDMAHGRFQRRMPVPQTRELAHLAEALHTMGERLNQLVADLSREKSHLEAILNSMADGVVVVDSAMNVTLTNRALADVLASPHVNEAKGLPLRESVPVPPLLDMFAQTLRHGRPQSTIVEWPGGENEGKSSRPRVLHVSTSPLWNPLQPLLRIGAVGIVRDVTDLRRLERVRSDFVANVSHELRTPLTVLQGFQETLLHSDVPKDRQRRFMEIMARETNRMVALVDDLLQLSELETGMKPLALEAVHLHQLVQQVYEAFADALEEKKIRWVGDFPPQLPPVRAEPRLLEQVLRNLVSNAMKYMGEDGGTITVAARLQEGKVEVAVTDTGIGIAPEHLPRLFERFYRVDTARSRQEGGTGLGLAIVRHIVERHGGRVWAESEPGHGTTFRLQLPRAQHGQIDKAPRFAGKPGASPDGSPTVFGH